MPKNLSPCNNPEDIRDFLFGGHCQICGDLNEETFRANHHPPMFLVYSLLQREMKRHYQLCDGDLVMALVMSEIWHFNITRYFDRSGHHNASEILSDPLRRQALLPACNAYSISQVLGVPSETVRRKVRKLIELGWVERNSDHELITTQLLESHFAAEESLDLARAFVSSARHLLAMVDGKPL